MPGQQRQETAPHHEAHWVHGELTYGGGCSGLPEVRGDWFFEGRSATCLEPAGSSPVRHVYHAHAVFFHAVDGELHAREERPEPCLPPRQPGRHGGPYRYDPSTPLRLDSDW